MLFGCHPSTVPDRGVGLLVACYFVTFIRFARDARSLLCGLRRHSESTHLAPITAAIGAAIGAAVTPIKFTRSFVRMRLASLARPLAIACETRSLA
jgi:hypothetical protein